MRSMTTDPAALPGALAEIEEVAGREAALRLAAYFGGGKIYVPRPRSITPAHPIARAIGVDAASKVAERFQGEAIEIPMARRALVRELAKEGLSTAGIVGRLKISSRAVRRYRR